MFTSLRNTLVSSLMIVTCLAPVCASAAGGIILGGTRIIYPQGAKQTTVSVQNSSTTSNFLIQSWAENSDGKKSSDFLITPPLYVSGPGNENILRLMYTGKALPGDRETLYYFNAKAIPSLDKNKTAGRNMLVMAGTTRIKLFMRPEGLKMSSNEAPSHLKFHRSNDRLKIDNPTPYYLTLVHIKSGNQTLQDIMVAPGKSESIPLPAAAKSSISFSTINDFGGISDPLERIL